MSYAAISLAKCLQQVWYACQHYVSTVQALLHGKVLQHKQLAEAFSVCGRAFLRIAPRISHHGHTANTLWSGRHSE